jgi:uncharacterized membrane protein
MRGLKRGAASAVGDAADTLSPYADQLAHDEKLRQRLIAAITAGVAARRRAQRQAGLVGLATRLASDDVLRAQLAEVAHQLKGARARVERKRRHRLRSFLLLLGGAGLVAAAATPAVRQTIMDRLRRAKHVGGPTATTVVEEIEVEAPVSAAYDRWTNFEEFPKFMEGVDEVKRLDDSLLHWAVTVGGKKAEWDARIIDQEPDRRIAWESVDGKRTRGTVTFEPAGPNRTRVRVNMTYTPDGPAEQIGSAAGLDDRRIRGDLERFRELIEGQTAVKS